MTTQKENKRFFQTKLGVTISCFFSILGLIIFVPSSIKEFNRNPMSPNFWLCLLFLCFFIFSIVLNIQRVNKLRSNRQN